MQVNLTQLSYIVTLFIVGFSFYQVRLWKVSLYHVISGTNLAFLSS